MLKKLIATAIISLGISGAAYFVMRGSPVLVPTLKNTDLSFEQENNKPALNQSDQAQSKPRVENWLTQTNSNVNNSLTGAFAKNIAEALLENNPGGPQTIDGQSQINVPEPEKLANNILAESAAKFDLQSLRPIIKDGDLNISQDAGQETFRTYLLNLQKIFEAGIANQPAELTADYASQLIDICKKANQALYKLAVPDSAVEIHKKIISVIGTKQNILEEMQKYQDDPLTLIMAIPALGQVEQEFVDLLKELANFFQDKI